jgi:MFS family permease
MAAFLAASSAEAGGGYGSISILTFGVIAIGGLGSWVAGLVADRWGRTMVAGGAMAISGTCALATPLIFGASAPIVIPVVLLWGITVVADSAQFSTMVTEVASQEVRGTALTLQTALGFLLTLVTIRGVPLLADALTWRWAFPVLAVGPALGVVAMARLRRSPDSVRLAAGRG